MASLLLNLISHVGLTCFQMVWCTGHVALLASRPVASRTAYARFASMAFYAESSSVVALRILLELGGMDGVSVPDFNEPGLWNPLSDNRLSRKPDHLPLRRSLMGRSPGDICN
jgi:hypothetical protein